MSLAIKSALMKRSHQRLRPRKILHGPHSVPATVDLPEAHRPAQQTAP